MFAVFCLMHDTQDDLAPNDYSYAHSVNAGVRRERAQRIHRAPETRGLVDEYGIPENPFAPQSQAVETPRPARRSRMERNVQPPAPAEPEGPQFAKPASPEVPDWLRIAQQNNLPAERPLGPRVQAAPQMRSDAYEQAGYPPELLGAQRQLEHQAAATPIHLRLGAQYAARPAYQPEQRFSRPAQPVEPMAAPAPRPQPRPEAKMSRAYHRPARQEAEPYEVEEDELDERTAPAFRIPWLAIGAFVAVAAAIVFWIMQTNYQTQTQQVLDDRAAQEAQILENHPLQYRELISDKANKYNLHPAFVAAIMLNESSFRPDASSSVDARGLMQLMDDTAGWIYEKMDDDSIPYDFDNLYNPEINAEYGCWYLHYLSDLFYGDPILVAAAFHAGQGEVRNWLNDSTYSKDGRTLRIEDMIDGPTKRYVTRVLNDYAAYKRLYFGG